MGRQNERTGPMGCGHLRGLFLSLGRGNLRTFPRLTEGSRSPTAPLPFRQNLIRPLKHYKDT